MKAGRLSRDDVLVPVDRLRAELAQDPAPVLLDVRWRLGEEPGAGGRRYDAAHLPGARFLDLETVLTTHTGDPLDGRHPLPDVATLQHGLGTIGVREDDDVVVYDEPGSFAAERAWWVLTWAGLRVRVLDGGLTAWTAAGGPTSDEVVTPPTSSPVLSTGHLPVLTADEAADLARTGVLLDARASERYRGETEPLDPRAGHVPGARNLPAAVLFGADGTLPDDAALTAAVDTVGAHHPDRPVGVYCGSGVSAARDVLALAALGRPAALFPGSWSAWSNDPARPVATGGDPG